MHTSPCRWFLMCAFLGCFALSTLTAAEPRRLLPVIADPPHATWATTVLKANHATMKDILSARMPNPTPQQQQAIELLDIGARWFVDDWQQTSLEAAVRVAAAAEGVEDAQVIYMRGVCMEKSGRSSSAIARYHEALERMSADGYPAIRRVGPLRRIFLLCNEVRPDMVADFARSLHDCLADLSTDPIIKTYQLDLIKSNLDQDSLPNPMARAAVLKVLQDPSLPITATRPLLGSWEIEEAWKARGSGWASSVTPEGWQGMKEHLAKARQLLMAAAAAEPQVSFAAGQMITVCMGQDRSGEESSWFKKAVSSIPDYPTAWSNMLYASTPRWGGSHAEMLALGQAALDTRRFDTDVPWSYLTAVWAIDEDLNREGDGKPHDLSIWRKLQVWRSIESLFDGYLVSPTMSEAKKHYNRILFGAYAVRCGQSTAGFSRLKKEIMTADELAMAARVAGIPLNELTEGIARAQPTVEVP